MSTDTEVILEHRAMAAYFRSRKTPAGGLPPSGTAIHSRVGERDGKSYVVLADGAGRTLVVYRVRNDGKLKELKRWPAEVAPR